MISGGRSLTAAGIAAGRSRSTCTRRAWTSRRSTSPWGQAWPVSISPKFWAEHLGLPYHQAAIRPNELPKRAKGSGPYAQSDGARSFLRYGYGDLLKSDRKYHIMHRIWPGTQKLLLWGDPVFAAGYGRALHFAGTSGVEIFDPLSFKGREGSGRPGTRDGYADASLRPAGGDFQKYEYTYRLWGRLSTIPPPTRKSGSGALRRDYGLAAGSVETALGAASQVLPLVTTAHLPSAANNSFWPEMYTNMGVIREPERPYPDTPLPRRFGTVSPLDPQLFSRIDDYAAELPGRGTRRQILADRGGAMAGGFRRRRGAPTWPTAEAKAVNPADPAFRRMAVDVRAQAGIGRFLGRKLRAGLLYSIYKFTGERAALDAALGAYHDARVAWAGIISATAGVYAADVSFGDSPYKRGHWSDRLAGIDRDLAAMANSGAADLEIKPGVAPGRAAAAIALVLGPPPVRRRSGSHTPPATFQPGRALPLAVTAAAGSAVLHYRQAQQAEAWRSMPLPADSGGFRGEIPADYTASSYPIEYYFEFRDSSGPWLDPAFAPNLDNQPYYLVLAEGAAVG